MYRTKKEEEEYRKLYFEDLMVGLLERVNKLEKDERDRLGKKKMKKKKIEENLKQNLEFDDLFSKKEKTVDDYRKVIFDLNDEIYERREMFNDGMCGYHRTPDNYDDMMKMFVLGQLDCIQTIKSKLRNED